MDKIRNDPPTYRPDRNIVTPDGLTGRQMLPPQAETFFFENSAGYQQRVVVCPPADGHIRHRIVLLPGLSEIAEKHAPTFHDFNEHGIEVIYLAPVGQDLSDREAANPELVTQRPVAAHAADLNDFVQNWVVPHTQGEQDDFPMIIVGLSHGGAIVHHYTTAFEHPFDKRVMGVMMAGIKEFDDRYDYERSTIQRALTMRQALPFPKSYIPTHFERTWRENMADPNYDDAFKRWIQANQEQFFSFVLTKETLINFWDTGKLFRDPEFYAANPNPAIPTLLIEASEEETVSPEGIKIVRDLIGDNVAHVVIHGMYHDGFNQPAQSMALEETKMRQRIMTVSMHFAEGLMRRRQTLHSLEPEIYNPACAISLMAEGQKEEGTSAFSLGAVLRNATALPIINRLPFSWSKPANDEEAPQTVAKSAEETSPQEDETPAPAA